MAAASPSTAMPPPASTSPAAAATASASARMLKLINWSKGHAPNAERIKVQKELFGFHKELRHGFPHKPTAMAWDKRLKLLALATKSGALRIYGAPGVEFYAEHEGESCALQMVFLPGQARLISLTEDNFLHLWQIDGHALKEIKSTHLDGRLKKITCLCLDTPGNVLLLGTEGGNIYQLNLAKFSVSENIIYQDIVMKGAPEDFKLNPGAVESVHIRPGSPSKILIGYTRGLMVLWDREKQNPDQTYVASQQLESLAWRNDGSEFISSHNDGSFMIWSINNAEPLESPNTPYGPYPCKAIGKILWSHDNGDAWTIFGGGMPRASYGDKYTVTVMKGEDKHVVFDLTSKIVDFDLIGESEGAPDSLLILAEEEMVLIDLRDETWPVFPQPYLNPIHASAVTALIHVADVDQAVMEKVREFGQSGKDKLSQREWPICGGTIEEKKGQKNDLLVTGHEDGSVKLWSCGNAALSLVAAIRSNKYFAGEDDLDDLPSNEDEDDDEEWPPFKKVGHFDPYSDDPRLAVKKLSFCGKTGKLAVGGTAGQVLVCELGEAASDKTIPLVKTDLTTEAEGFTWKGHSSLTAKPNQTKLDKGFQAKCILQISPPASINSLVINTDWGLVAAGTAHGIVLLDTVHNSSVVSKCTLNAQDIANADDNPMSRRKSLKKSLRESFRRLRKGRSQRNIEKKRPGAPTADPIKRELGSMLPKGPQSSGSSNCRIRHHSSNCSSSGSSSKAKTRAEMLDDRIQDQVKYHWKKVQRLSSSGNFFEAHTLHHFGSKEEGNSSFGEKQTQTQDFLGKSAHSSVLKFKLPNWYWTGVQFPPVSNSVPNFRSLRDSSMHFVDELGAKSTELQSWMKKASASSKKQVVDYEDRIRRNRFNESRPLQKRRDVAMRRGSILDQIDVVQPKRNTVKKEMLRKFRKSYSSSVERTEEEPQIRGNKKRLELQTSSEEESALRRRRLTVQRSFSVDNSPANAPSFKGWDTLRKSHRKGLIACANSLRSKTESRKELRKAWNETYVGMCNRANVLNKVLECAVKEEVAVKPINSVIDLNTDNNGGKQSKKFVGLSKQFYNVGDEAAKSEEDSLEIDVISDRRNSIEVLADFEPSSALFELDLDSSLADITSNFPLVRDKSTQVDLINLPALNYAHSRSESPEARPVERQIEARQGSEDGLGSMVRCIHFANTFIASPQTESKTLWAGTNSGQILVFLLTLPSEAKRKEEKVQAMLGKEIQLKHRAPVIDIVVIDSAGSPVLSGSKSVPHKVLIASEEQFKTFLLPTLKASGKYKLTAHEGARIRRIGFATFAKKSDPSYTETCFGCLTNQGDISIHGLQDLRRQAQTNCMKKEDVIAISTLAFSPQGEAFYMRSSSEVQRVAVTAEPPIKLNGVVEIEAGARDAVEEKDEEAENRQNEIQATKTAASPGGDVHNETVVSEISADITLDSVKDHTQQIVETSVSEASSANRVERTEVTKVTTTSSSSVTTEVIKATKETKAEEKAVVVNGNTSEEPKPLPEKIINGVTESLQSASINVVVTEAEDEGTEKATEDEDEIAPLASMESTGTDYPSLMSTDGGSSV